MKDMTTGKKNWCAIYKYCPGCGKELSKCKEEFRIYGYNGYTGEPIYVSRKKCKCKWNPKSWVKDNA